MRPPIIRLTAGSLMSGVPVPANVKEPLVMVTTASLGPKLDAALRVGAFSGLGHDLVATVADDLAALGARPVGVSCFRSPHFSNRENAIEESLREACQIAGCVFLGMQSGLPTSTAPTMVGTAIGFADGATLPAQEETKRGDVVIGMLTNDLRLSGFEPEILDQIDGDGLGALVQPPATIYTPAVMAAVEIGAVHGMVNIARGGLAASLARLAPEGLSVDLDQEAWSVPHVFRSLQNRLGYNAEAMFMHFNMGIGFLLAVVAEYAEPMLAVIGEYGGDPRIIGRMVATDG